MQGELPVFGFAFLHQIHSFSFFVLFLPSAYVIETYGIKKAITGAMVMTAVGLWLCYFKFTIPAGVLLGASMPVCLISCTKMSATWFGPRARNLATMCVVLCFYSPEALQNIYDDKIIQANLAFAITSTIIAPVSYFLLYSNPDFSPSMSEEERFINGPIPFWD